MTVNQRIAPVPPVASRPTRGRPLRLKTDLAAGIADDTHFR